MEMFFASLIVACFYFTLLIYGALALYMLWVAISLILINGELPLAAYIRSLIDKRIAKKLEKINSFELKFEIDKIRQDPYDEYLTRYLRIRKEIAAYK